MSPTPPPDSDTLHTPEADGFPFSETQSPFLHRDRDRCRRRSPTVIKERLLQWQREWQRRCRWLRVGAAWGGGEDADAGGDENRPFSEIAGAAATGEVRRRSECGCRKLRWRRCGGRWRGLSGSCRQRHAENGCRRSGRRSWGARCDNDHPGSPRQPAPGSRFPCPRNHPGAAAPDKSLLRLAVG